MNTKEIKARLEELRIEIREERISYGELFELQGLAEHIEEGDVELLQWAGVPEFPEDKWKCTDPDMNQWGRKTGNKTYEFKQDMKYPDGSIITEEDEINLDNYTDKEINEHLSTYSWSIELLKEENSNEDAEWLMAECIFEQTV